MCAPSSSNRWVPGGHFIVQGLLSIGSQFVSGAQGLLTFLLAGRLLPPTEFGFVVVANAILFGGQSLLLGPVTNPTLRLGAISNKSVRVTYWIYFAVTGIVCSTFVLLAEPLGGVINAEPAFYTLIRYLSIPFAITSFYSVQRLILLARMRYHAALIMDTLYAASNIIFLVLLHWNAMLSSAIWFYMARSAAALVGLVPFVCLHTWLKSGTSSDSRHSQSKNVATYREYIQHSKYSLVSMISSYCQGQVDTLAVAHYQTPISVATYGAGKIFKQL